MLCLNIRFRSIASFTWGTDKADNTPWSSYADCCVKRCAIAYAFRNAFDASASHLDDFFDGFSVLAGYSQVRLFQSLDRVGF